MQTYMKYAAAALFAISSATAAHAGGFGFGGHGGGGYSGGSLLNLSPAVGVSLLDGSSVLNGNRTNILSGILNGSSIASGNGILNNLLGGNTSVSNRGNSHRGHHRR